VSPTIRFFCACGRLLNAIHGATSILCPTCGKVNAVPGSSPARADDSRKTSLMMLRPGAVVDQYRIEAILGQGGMGTVYRGVHQKTGEPVAIKVLNTGGQGRTDLVSRFQREARTLAEVTHPNIVRILASGFDGSSPYLVMELLVGEHLMSRLEKGEVTEAEAIAWMLQAAKGLYAAASKGIIHRDIKPSNLVLLKNGQLKIADFGLAKAADSESHLTLTGEVLGTPYYMAPEQGRGKAVDQRTDLYSLGATFYHLLSRAPPFEAETPVAVIMRHMNDEPRPLREVAKVSEGMEAVIHRLLQKNPQDRYPDYATLIEDLERLARGEKPVFGSAPPARKIHQGRTTFLLPAEPTTELLLRSAGFLRRLAAFAVDCALLEATWLLSLWCLRRLDVSVPIISGNWFPPPQAFTETSGLFVASTMIVLGYAYFAAGDSSGGRTIGRRLMGLRLCRPDGSDLGISRALLRSLLILPALFLISPHLQSAILGILQSMGAVFTHLAIGRSLAAGSLLLIGYHAIGHLSTSRGALQDVLADARMFRAEPAALVASRIADHSRLSLVNAAAFSVIPGMGLVYVRHYFLGLLFLALIVGFFVEGRLRQALALWIVSALLSIAFTRQAQQRRTGSDKTIVRQET